VKPISVLNKKKPSLVEEGIRMGQKASGWAIIAGCFLMATGLCFLPAALGSHPDPAILGAGVCVFAFGALMAAGGFYLKARVLQAGAPAEPAQPKRVRGGCDLCGTDSPVINCRVHQLHLCGECLREHYDFRSCVYVPSTRRPAASKPLARAAKA
jgi:ribosomal protein S14